MHACTAPRVAGEVRHCRDVRRATAGMSATKVRGGMRSAAARMSAASRVSTAAAAAGVSAFVIGDRGSRNRSKHYSHRAYCECGLPHGSAPKPIVLAK
jgi:hypothetical protein